MKRMGEIILVALTAMSVQTGFAESLNDLDLYSRCYVRMVRLVPDVTDPIYQQVVSGSLKGDAACLKLFDTAAFTDAGVMVNRTSQPARRIVKTFHDLHRTWFTARVPSETEGAALLIADMEEPALYFTRATFQSVPFSSVVTLSQGLQGLRDRVIGGSVGGKFQAQRILTYSSSLTYAASPNLILSYLNLTISTDAKGKQTLTSTATPMTIADSGMVDVGELAGVKPANSLIFPSFLSVADATVRTAAVAQANGFNANAHFGGGVLGSQGFLNANFNLAAGVLAVDATTINRRVTARVFEDLLCQQLPTLNGPGASTGDDVSAELDPQSPYTFRQSTSCLQCHSSIDNAGYTLRNLFMFRSSSVRNEVGQFISAIGGFTPVANSNVFSLQPPTGRLHYRENLTGTLKDDSVNSLADVGSHLAQGNDLYLCAAKRYYKFFTGVDVNLSVKATSALDKTHQDFVVKLGKDLQKSQNVRAMLGEIFSSPAFRSRNYLTTEAK